VQPFMACAILVQNGIALGPMSFAETLVLNSLSVAVSESMSLRMFSMVSLTLLALEMNRETWTQAVIRAKALVATVGGTIVDGAMSGVALSGADTHSADFGQGSVTTLL
jgi:hypothetical protein